MLATRAWGQFYLGCLTDLHGRQEVYPSETSIAMGVALKMDGVQG